MGSTDEPSLGFELLRHPRRERLGDRMNRGSEPTCLEVPYTNYKVVSKASDGVELRRRTDGGCRW